MKPSLSVYHGRGKERKKHDTIGKIRNDSKDIYNERVNVILHSWGEAHVQRK